ncbi:hypothetical protein ACMFMG_002155 [Clarireedia jacksonii]
MIIGIFFSIHLTRDFWIPCPLRIFVAASQIVPGLGSPFMIHTFFFRQLALAADYSTERFFALVGGHLRASEVRRAFFGLPRENANANSFPHIPASGLNCMPSKPILAWV